jgi:hypothetical protein
VLRLGWAWFTIEIDRGCVVFGTAIAIKCDCVTLLRLLCRLQSDLEYQLAGINIQIFILLLSPISNATTQFDVSVNTDM